MIALDDMLTAEQAAPWLQLSEKELLSKSKGPRATIPGFWINARVVRFHPRTIIAKLAKDAGVPEQTISASLTKPQMQHEQT